MPEINGEYIERMERILDLLAKPASKLEPIVCWMKGPCSHLIRADKEGAQVPERSHGKTTNTCVRAQPISTVLLHRMRASI